MSALFATALRLLTAPVARDVVDTALLGDAELIRRARDGDPDAPRELVRRHGARLARVAYATLGDWSAAEDVVQETLVRAMSEIDRLRDDNAVIPWLSRIAVRIGIDGQRKVHRESLYAEPPIDRVDPLPSAEGRMEEAQDRDRVVRAMATLPVKARELLALRYDAGFTVAEIAAATGKSEVAVRKDLQRARDKLRALLAPWFEEA